MWGTLVILICSSFRTAAFVTNTSVDCKEYSEHVPESLTCAPSPLAKLAACETASGNGYLLNVSWAVAVDSTITCVEGIVIETSQQTLKCDYIPPLSEANFSETQIWFHYTVNILPADIYTVSASNIPTPPFESGSSFINVNVHPPRREDPSLKYEDRVQSHVTTPAPRDDTLAAARVRGEYIVFGVLMVCVMLVLFGYVIYKIRGACLALDYEKVGSAPGGPAVPVLVVYPAESELFQWAVGALAEFLQQHGGCSVAVDMWQQGSVAKLGPMRWLLEQVQAAHRVLIVAAQPSPETLPIPGASIPAAAQDLHALALNLVAGQAKNSSDLAKFWVVRFGESTALASELRACRSFSLMKDLDKLCRCLHKQDGSMKIADLILRRIYCSRDDTEKLRAAVQALNGQQGSVTKDQNIA